MYNTLINTPKFYKAGIYIRLSEADEGKSYEADSESVQNQRSILTKFVKDNGFVLAGEYVDDGFSGTNFERPGFSKLIEDIKNKVINLVIVKDLSRLGRDHVMTGYFVETFFPENNIRFISIQEGYDNANKTANNDMAGFIFAFNDYYSKNNSIKIRNVLTDKRKVGRFVGSTPSYGYQRDPLDKGHLIIDTEYAKVVKKIFTMADSGIGLSEITTYLNDNKIKTPSSLKRKNPNANNRYNPMWTISSVKKILKNQIYVGDMVQGAQTKVSYKSKKKKTLPKSSWDIVPNTHEAIVDREMFNRVQNNVKRTKKTNNVKRDKRLFENLLFCKECGNTLTISYRKNHDYWTVNCNRYSRDPKRRMCEPHFIPYNKLEKALLEVILTTCKKYLDKISITNIASEISLLKKNNKRIESQLADLDIKEKEFVNKIDMLYEDKFRGLVSEETYKRISNEVESGLKNIREEKQKLKNQNIEQTENSNYLKEVEEKISKLLDIENPTRDLLLNIIDKIVIDKDRNIEIKYKFSILNNI